MKLTGGKIVARALADEKVRLVFGIPGTHNIELYDAMIEEETLVPVLVADEQSAGFMADGAARASGELAAINLVPGAGLTHALSGIAEAWLDQVPMLVLACGIRGDTGSAYQLHDVDQASIVRSVVKHVYQPGTHAELYSSIRLACALARRAPRGPVAVEVPANLYVTLGEPDLGHTPALEAPRTPDRGELDRAVELLNDSRTIGLYVGLGAAGAGGGLIDLAEALDAVVYTTISGKGVFPEDHPRWAWNLMGRASPSPMREIESGLDAVLAIGCRFGEVATGSYGLSAPRRLIHVDVDPRVFNRNYPATLAIESDAEEFVRALLTHPGLHPRAPSGERLQRLGAAQAAVRSESAAEAGESGTIAPEALFGALQDLAGPEAVYVTDSGNGTFLAMEQLRLARPRSFLAPVDYSCMGYCVPAAIGARLAAPSRPVIALAGDGAFMMTGFEIATAAALRTGILVVLLRDGELSQIAQFQRASLARETCTQVAGYDASALARGLGAAHVAVSAGSLREDLARALEATGDGPVIAEVPIDYSRPTHFSKGVLKTNFLRFPWRDRLRLATRVIGRKLIGR